MEVIYDESRCRWGYKYDIPWDTRVSKSDGWFDEGWFICNDRKFKENIQIQQAIDKAFAKIDIKKIPREKVDSSKLSMSVPLWYKESLDEVKLVLNSESKRDKKYKDNKDGNLGFTAKKNRDYYKGGY